MGFLDWIFGSKPERDIKKAGKEEQAIEKEESREKKAWESLFQYVERELSLIEKLKLSADKRNNLLTRLKDIKSKAQDFSKRLDYQKELSESLRKALLRLKLSRQKSEKRNIIEAAYREVRKKYGGVKHDEEQLDKLKDEITSFKESFKTNVRKFETDVHSYKDTILFATKMIDNISKMLDELHKVTAETFKLANQLTRIQETLRYSSEEAQEMSDSEIKSGDLGPYSFEPGEARRIYKRRVMG